jgi:recombination protein RecT
MTQENSSGTQVVSTQSTKMPAQAKKIDVLKTMLNAPSVMEQFKNALSKNASTFVASIIDLFKFTIMRAESGCSGMSESCCFEIANQ